MKLTQFLGRCLLVLVVVLMLGISVGMSVPPAPSNVVQVALVEQSQIVGATVTSVLKMNRCGMPLRVSTAGATFIKRFEGFSERAYLDTDGTYAIGYGMHQWAGLQVTEDYPGIVTRAQADQEFRKQVRVYERIVLSAVCAPLTQHGFDALTSVAFNLGAINRSIVRKLHAQEPVTVHDFLTTANVNGKRDARLVLRRTKEFHLFTGKVL